MANPKIEGTFRLDGLLEGPIFSVDDEDIINSFVKDAKKAGLKFHAAINTGRFSLLADTESINIQPGGEPADARVVKCIGEFLKNYSPEECRQLMSTLRSVEYIPGHEIQTIYYIKPDCTVAVEQRTVKADTIAPMKPIELRQAIKPIIIFAVILCAGIGISAFFVPYSDLAKRLINKVMPFDTHKLIINVGPYMQFFQVESAEANKSKGIILITCKVSQSYPNTEQKLNELWKSSGESITKRLTIEALMRNNVRCVSFDSEGNFLGQRICYMQWIGDEKESFDIVIPFDNNLRQVNISY